MKTVTLGWIGILLVGVSYFPAAGPQASSRALASPSPYRGFWIGTALPATMKNFVQRN